MAKNNPWLALSTYEEKDKKRFKGREQDTQNMLKMLQQNEYVVCYAASGDGKSSLINAGVCPEMRKIGYFPIKIVFSSDEYEGINIPRKGKDNTIIDFDACILKKIEESSNYFTFEVNNRFSSFPAELSSNLWWKLRTQTVQVPYGVFDYIPVLIFDQFEEILRAKWKNEFFAWLEELSSDECPDSIYDKVSLNEKLPSRKKFKAIFSMRYEYVGELDYWCSQRHFIPQMMRGRYFLKPLNEKQAISIITEQSEGDDRALGIIKENAENIIDGLKKQNSAEDAEISAILLSILCYVYYNNIYNNGKNELPDTKNLISTFYTDKLKELNLTDRDEADIEDKLVTSEGYRKRSVLLDDVPTLKKNVRYSEEGSNSSKLPLWEVLKKAHLLYVENSGVSQYVEFVHDKLAEAAFDQRNLRNKRRKADFVKILFFIIGLCFFIGVFVHQSNTKIVFDNTVVANDVDKFAEYQVINADSSGVLNSVSLRKIKLESNTGHINFYFGNLPNLQEVVLCDTLRNNYRWGNGILMSLNRDHNKESILFASDNASRSIGDISQDSMDYHGVQFYNAKYLNDNRDSLTKVCLTMEGNTLLGLREPASSLDTVDLKKYSWIKSIGKNAFEGCQFRHVILPDSLSRISSYAFKKCDRLKTVVFSNTTRLICDPYSFYKCDAIEEIDLPDSCFLSNEALYDCISLRKISSTRNVFSSDFPHCDNVTYLCRRDSNNTVKTDTINEHKTETIINFKYISHTNNYSIEIKGRCGVTYGPREFITVLLDKDVLSEISQYVPVQIRRSPRELTDIYIIRKDVSPLFNGLDSIDCSHITLHVPYNTLEWMKDRYADSHFKEITEMSLAETSFYSLVDILIRTRKFSFLFLIGLTVLGILHRIFLSRNKQTKNKYLQKTLSFRFSYRKFALNALLAFIFGVATFWSIYFYFEGNKIYTNCGGIAVGLMIFCISLKSDWIQDNSVRLIRRTWSAIMSWIKKERKLCTYVFLPLVFILFSASYFYISYSHYSESIQNKLEVLIADGDVKTIAAIMNEGMLSADTSKIDNSFLTQQICAVEYEYPDIKDAVLDAEGRYLYTITTDSVLSKWDVDNNNLVNSVKLPNYSCRLYNIKYSNSNNSVIVSYYKDTTFRDPNASLEVIHYTDMQFIELDTDLNIIAERNITVKGYAFHPLTNHVPDISDDAKKILSYDGNILTISIVGSSPIDYTFNSPVHRAKWIDNTRFGVITDSLRIFDIASNQCVTSIPLGDNRWEYDYNVRFGSNNVLVKRGESLYDWTIDGKLRNSMVITRLNVETVHNLNNSYAVSWQDSVFIYNTKNDLISKKKIRGSYYRTMLKANKNGTRFVDKPFSSKWISVYDTNDCREIMHLGTPAHKQIVEAGPDRVLMLSEDMRVYEVDFKRQEIHENEILSQCYPDFLTTSKDGVLAVCGGKLMQYENSTVKEYTALNGDPHSCSFIEFQESPNGDLYISTHWMKSCLYLWDGKSGQVIDSLDCGSSRPRNIAFSSNGNYIMAHCNDSTFVWDLKNMTKKGYHGRACFGQNESVMYGTNDRHYVASTSSPWFINYTWTNYCLSNTNVSIQNDKGILRDIQFLQDNKYCVTTDEGFYLYATDKMEFIKNCHLTKQQLEEFNVPWWIYAFKKVWAYLGND